MNKKFDPYLRYFVRIFMDDFRIYGDLKAQLEPTCVLNIPKNIQKTSMLVVARVVK